jgi:ATP-dependent DNA helicase RecQ
VSSEKRGASWFATGEEFTLDVTRFTELTTRRNAEYARMQEYARGGRCLMAYVAEELDDPAAQDCGRCMVCIGRAILPTTVDRDVLAAAVAFSPAATGRPRSTRRKKPSPMTKRTIGRRKKPKA